MARLDPEAREVVLKKLSEAIAAAGEAKADYTRTKDGQFQISITAPEEGTSSLTREMVSTFSAAAL